MRPIAISSWGAHARRFAETHTSACVAAVFARSFHLEADGDFMCIGDAGTVAGPLNAITDLPAVSWTASCQLVVSSSARIGNGAVQCGPLTIVTTTAADWLPLPGPRHCNRSALTLALDDLERVALKDAPVNGIARIALGLAGGATSGAAARVARPRLASLRDWLSARLARRPVQGPAPVDLLGLGPGLTPSGDDLLCGALVALHAIGKPDTARALHAAIAEAAPCATTRLSAAFLRAAADGHASEPIHGTIIALLKNRDVAPSLMAVGAIGHTSGWDALAGAVLVLQAFCSKAGHVCPVARPRISL